MAFCFPKACGGVGSLSLPFSFCQPCMIFRAVVPAWLPVGTTAYRQGWCCRSRSRLDEGEHFDELMNIRYNILTFIIIHPQHPFIKPLAKRKVMYGAASAFFSSAKFFCWVLDEDVNRCYSLCLYMLSSFHQNNKCRLCNLSYRILADLQTATKT